MTANSVAKRCVRSGGVKTKEIWVGLRSAAFIAPFTFCSIFSNWMPGTCYLTLSDQNKLEQPRKQKLFFLTRDCTTNTWLPRPNWIALFPRPDTLTRLRNHKKINTPNKKLIGACHANIPIAIFYHHFHKELKIKAGGFTIDKDDCYSFYFYDLKINSPHCL